MIGLFILLAILLYIGNKRQGGAIFKYCIFQRHGFQNLQKHIIAYGYQYHLHQHILLCVLCAVLITIGGFIFQLQIQHIVILIISFLFLIPLFVLWSSMHAYQEQLFNDFTTFLQHFIALFKINPKLYQTLVDCEVLVEHELKEVVQEVIAKIEQGDSLEEAFLPLQRYCPHFILRNLLTITTAVEEHGSHFYHEGLDFIQDDIDDWIEDVYLFKKQQIQAKNRMLVLCGFAGIIALVSKQMLSQIDFRVNSPVYQLSMSLFFICIGITMVMAHRILQESWIDKEEYVCWD